MNPLYLIALLGAAGVFVYLVAVLFFEYKLLAMLLANLGKVVTHRQLLREVWGPNHVDDTHYLRVYMAGLRRKLEVDANLPRHLRTEPGVGYRLVE